jgi:hypothetical protein
MKIGICYFSEKIDECLELSINQSKTTLSHANELEWCIYVFSDKNETTNGVVYKKLWNDKDMYGKVYTVLKNLSIVKKREKCDYVLLADTKCFVNNIDYVIGSHLRLLKGGLINGLGEMVSRDTVKGTRTLSDLGIRYLMECYAKSEHIKDKINSCADINDALEAISQNKNNYRFHIDKIEGVKSYCHYNKDEDIDYSDYNFVCFEDSDEMKEFQWKQKENELEKFLSGKTVSIVGNAMPENDYSEEIDKSDVVIRINNFYHYDTNKIGKKVDALIVTGLSAYGEEEPTQKDIIKKYKPKVFCLSETRNQNIKKIGKKFDCCEINMLRNDPFDICYTTGTILLKTISKMSGITDISLFCFDTGKKWEDYVDNYANVHKVLSCGRENDLRNDLLKNSCKK